MISIKQKFESCSSVVVVIVNLVDSNSYFRHFLVILSHICLTKPDSPFFAINHARCMNIKLKIIIVNLVVSSLTIITSILALNPQVQMVFCSCSAVQVLGLKPLCIAKPH